MSAEALKREDKVVKREKAATEQGKAIQARYDASKVKVDDLKRELEDSDQIRLELVDLLQRAQERIVIQDGELRKLREEKEEKEIASLSEIKALKEEVESIYVLTRFTARAALMQQHVQGLKSMEKAQEELDFFLTTIGDEDDLDRDDRKDVDEEMVGQGDAAVQEGMFAQEKV